MEAQQNLQKQISESLEILNQKTTSAQSLFEGKDTEVIHGFFSPLYELDVLEESKQIFEEKINLHHSSIVHFMEQSIKGIQIGYNNLKGQLFCLGKHKPSCETLKVTEPLVDPHILNEELSTKSIAFVEKEKNFHEKFKQLHAAHSQGISFKDFHLYDSALFFCGLYYKIFFLVSVCFLLEPFVLYYFPVTSFKRSDFFRKK
jgi:hypothetical protein